MKDMPGFIKELVRVLAFCEDVDEATIISLSSELWNRPRTAGLLRAYAEIGYCNDEMILSEYKRLSRFTEGA